MRFLLWLAQRLDALARSRRQIVLGALGLAALAALAYYGPSLLERDSGKISVRAPTNEVSKPLGLPTAIETAPAGDPAKPIISAVAQAPATAPAPAPAPASAPAPAAATKPAPAVPASARPGTYQVQLGAFREEDRARNLAQQVQQAGFETAVIGVDLPQLGRMYRVRLKPDLSHEDARRLLAQLKKKMPKQKPIVVRSGG